MPDEEKRSRFARLVLPHMDAAMGLARWLLRDSASAEDAVQEAYLRAFRFFHSLRGENARPWLLGIVRNTCLTLLEQERQNPGAEFDEAIHGEDSVATGAVVWLSADPEASAIARSEREQVQRCLRALPVEYREVIVLRELHGCSYQEISQIAGVPIGTVMSRLSRARERMRAALDGAPAASAAFAASGDGGSTALHRVK